MRTPGHAWETCSLASGEGPEARDRCLGSMRSKPLCGCLLDGAAVRMGVRSHATGRTRAGESENSPVPDLFCDGAVQTTVPGWGGTEGRPAEARQVVVIVVISNTGAEAEGLQGQDPCACFWFQRAPGAVSLGARIAS